MIGRDSYSLNVVQFLLIHSNAGLFPKCCIGCDAVLVDSEIGMHESGGSEYVEPIMY